jgi:DNA invertase Pin-like site-specific DNA recombinase
MKPAVAYIRTSTARQTLGLDAQAAALDRFAQAEGFNIVATFSEPETGKGADALARRPKLKEALKVADKHKAPI